jgi:hypothetical protein
MQFSEKSEVFESLDEYGFQISPCIGRSTISSTTADLDKL